MIKTLKIEQLLVSSLLDNFTIIDHNNLVSIPDGAQPMGDHKTCATLHEAQQSFLDAYLGARVNAASGFIQDQDSGFARTARAMASSWR